MKLAYIILSLVFLLTASYGLEMFIASRKGVKILVKIPDKRDDKKVLTKSKRIDAGKISKELECDVQMLLSNNFFDQSRNVISGRNENMPAELKLENIYQLQGVLEIGDSKTAVIVNRNQPQRGPPVKGKVADKRTFLLGDTIGSSYKLSEIGTKSVKFTRDGREQELSMFQGKNGTVQAIPGNMPGMPPDPNMSRPPRSLRGGAMVSKP